MMFENDHLFTMKELDTAVVIARRQERRKMYQVCVAIAVALKQSSEKYAESKKGKELAPVLMVERAGVLRCVEALKKIL